MTIAIDTMQLVKMERPKNGWQQNVWDNDKSIYIERIPKITIGQGNNEICTATHSHRNRHTYSDTQTPMQMMIKDLVFFLSPSRAHAHSLSISLYFHFLMEFQIDFMNALENPRCHNANGLALSRQWGLYTYINIIDIHHINNSIGLSTHATKKRVGKIPNRNVNACVHTLFVKILQNGIW